MFALGVASSGPSSPPLDSALRRVLDLPAGLVLVGVDGANLDDATDFLGLVKEVVGIEEGVE